METTILGVAEAVLYVNDVDASATFFQDTLALPLSMSFDGIRFLQTGEASTLILFSSEHLKTRISPVPGHGMTGEGHVAFAIGEGEYDAWLAKLRDSGIEIEHEQVWSLGTRSLYFRDPDNNSIELIEGHHYPTVYQKITNDS